MKVKIVTTKGEVTIEADGSKHTVRDITEMLEAVIHGIHIDSMPNQSWESYQGKILMKQEAARQGIPAGILDRKFYVKPS